MAAHCENTDDSHTVRHKNGEEEEWCFWPGVYVMKYECAELLTHLNY